MNLIRSMTPGRARQVRFGAAGLVAAGVIVSVAIATDGAVSRGINGVGAIVWLGSTVALMSGLRDSRRWSVSLALAAAVTLTLSFAVEPTNIATAVPGFAVGGAILALMARPAVAWAVVVPALWLPVHLLTAVVPAIIRASTGGEASVRTDPPPTAAVVPLLMVLSAAMAGGVIGVIRDRKASRGRAASRLA